MRPSSAEMVCLSVSVVQEKLQDDRKTIESKLLAQACTKEIDVAVLNEEADKSFEQLSKKPTEKEIIKRGKE